MSLLLPLIALLVLLTASNCDNYIYNKYTRTSPQILLQAEVLDLKANPNRLAQGVVIEAAMRQGLGPVATTLIQRGTLRTGDIFVSGASYGKVRLLMDHTGKRVKEALPSMPVQIVGFDTVPGAGDNFMVVDKEETARAVAEARKKILREAQVCCAHNWLSVTGSVCVTVTV
jgi:translation initiation factor IF-2